MKPTKSRPTVVKTRLQLLHQYYKYTGFYAFVSNAIKKALPIISILVLAFYVFDHFFDINVVLMHLTEIMPVYAVLAFFFTSEALLGIIPPEIFIVWSGNLPNPWMYLGILAVLSYVGGLVSYYIGQVITKIPYIHRYFEAKLSKQLKNSRKWGGFLIVVGALLPLPFSIACMAAGFIGFPFKNVVLFGSLRLARFAIYGMIIFNML